MKPRTHGAVAVIYSTQMAKRAGAGPSHLSGASVMIVEDDPAAAEHYATWLRTLGHRVSIASDAACALVLAPIVRPNVALIKLDLPGVDGLELLKQLREFPELEFCQYIMVTGDADTGLTAICGDADVAGVFPRRVLADGARRTALQEKEGRFRLN